MMSVVGQTRTERLWRFLLSAVGLWFVLWFTQQSFLNAAVADVPSQDLPHAWQTVWNVAHGHGFRYSDVLLGTDQPRLAAHADYFLALLAPLAWLWDDYRGLLILQVFGVALGAVGLWRVAKRQTGSEPAAGLVTLGYLLSGPLQFAVTFQFHAVTLVLPLLLWAVEAIIYRRRGWIVWVWFGLALTTKEQVGLIGGPLLWWFAWQQKRKALAWTTLAAGVAWSVIHFLWIIPAARVGAVTPHLFWQFYYGSLGSTPGEILPRLLQPSEIVSRLGTAEMGQSVAALLLPLGLLPLLSPLLLLAAASLLPHWLADYFAVSSLYYHNHVLAMAPLLLAGVEGWRVIARWPWWRSTRTLLGWGWALAIVIASVIFSPNPWSLKFLPGWRESDPRLAELRELTTIVPADRTVAVAWGLPPLWRGHPTVYTLPAGINAAEYIVVGPSVQQGLLAYAPTYASELQAYFAASSAFTLVAQRADVLVYRRRTDRVPEPLPAQFSDPTLHGQLPKNE